MDLVGRVSNNLFEFIAEVICIWVDILEGEINLYDCCLSLGDNSSVMSWLHRSNIDSEDQRVHEEAARHYASLYIDTEVCPYSQHFKGVWNVVADSLSCHTHIPDDVLTSLLYLVCPEQMPRNFHISPLPPEIESWVFRTLHLSSKPPLDPKEQTTSTIGRGFVGNNFLTVSSYPTIRSWILSQRNFNLPSVLCSLKLSETGSLVEKVRQIWQQTRSERPWTKW